ncbi:MAG: polysaccharide deacetylase family protein [Methanomassiliicoccus sp.]|nr:polysaccharide deacetylase family protein [Methanomassiliicoccus sp.]
MRYAAFTVDVDRDVNEARAGNVESLCRRSTVTRYTSTRKGLQALVEMLDDLGVRGTFFWEGRAAEVLSGELKLRNLMQGHEVAAHGYEHEDLTGESTGVRLSEEWLDAIVGRSLSAVEGAFGFCPEGFRCPYQHIDDTVARVLMQRGLRYDSTRFGEVGAGLRPYRLTSPLLEVPLAQGRDATGRRLQSYLWPMHEGRRGPDDYLHLMSLHDDGLLVLADHSWHIAESLDGECGANRMGRELAKVRRVLEGAMDRGIELVTVAEYLRSNAADR